MLRKALLLLLASWTIQAGVDRRAYAQEKLAGLTQEIPPAALAEEGGTAQIRAFDLAPDGTSVGVLYSSWKNLPHPPAAELWVAMWNLSSNKPVWKQKLGTDTTSGAARIHDVKDLIFTADQKHLVVLAVKSVWCLDAKSGETSVSVSPPSNTSGTPVQMLGLAGSSVAITYSQDEDANFYTQLIDASYGRKTNGWATSAIPQSFSADGKLAIAVIPGHGAADLKVIDTATGANLRTVAVASEKRDPDDGVFAVAKFLDDTHVVVSSNHRIDRPKKHAAYSLEYVDVSNGQLVREITPEYFRPDGDIVVAADRNRFAVGSVYARERDLLWDSPRPRDLRVSLLVFSKDGAIPEKVIPNVYAGLPGGKGKPLRLSSDGSVLAVSESPSGSIKIFQIKTP